MDFRLRDEQIMLFDTVSSMLGEQCAGARLRALLERGDGLDAARWSEIVALGLPGVMGSERAGGAGLGALEMALIALAAGKAALPEPLVEHAGVCVPLLARANSDWLGRAIGGEIIAIGHPINPFVANADSAAALLLAHGGELHLVPSDSVVLKRQESIDPFRRLFRVDWTANTASRLATGPAARDLWDAAFDRGALFAAAQALGVAERAVEFATAYAKERRQFGKPIGSFQAVKHLIANVQVKIEFARPVLFAAAAHLDGLAPLAPTRISHAKIACCAAADAAVHTALQVHGAIGYSWETDIHFFLKRALALSNAWGTTALHRARVCAHVMAQKLGPEHTFGAAAKPEAALEPA